MPLAYEGPATVADQELAQSWIDWARKQADLLDPLQENTALITSLNVELESWFSGSHYVSGGKRLVV